GYDKIPAYWKMGLKEAENIDFKYTTMSLSHVYEIGLRHALQNIERNGGKIRNDNITINVQQPATVKFEKSFEGVYPVAKIPVTWNSSKDEISFAFEGTGFVLKGEAAKWGSESNYVFNTELFVDGKLVESPKLPASYTTRRYELCWKYDLAKGKHTVRLKISNPSKDEAINASEAIIYSDQIINGIKTNEEAAKKIF
ncbi:MAG TPA: hypothetical protein VK588_10035, partial [Chitinophagaceae bacterium]|nr:hypothetical protein [Chitinophagaceae bacterium]